MKTCYRRTLIRRPAWLWGSLSILILIVVITVGFLCDPAAMSSAESFSKPGLPHLFGTDNLGRDLFVRTLIGFRNTFLIALLSQLPAVALGVLIGTLLGYYGSMADELFFYIFNVLIAFPTVLAAVFLSLYLGRGIHTAVIIGMIYGILYNIKLVRTEVQLCKNSDYVLGLALNGISHRGILFSHLIPRAFWLLLPILPLLIAHTMLGISALSYLGLGVQAPTPELGTILKDSLRFASRAPHMIILPGLFQFSSVLVFSLWSDALEKEVQQRRLGGVRS